MHEILAVGLMEVAGEGPVEGVGAEGRPDLGEGDPVGLAGSHVDGDLNGAFLASVYIGRSNPVHILKVIEDLLVDEVADTVGASAASDLQLHELVGELLHIDPGQGHRELLRKGLTHLVDLLLQLQIKILEVDIFLKADLNGGLPVIKPGLHILYPLQGSDGSLHGDHRLVFHVVGIDLLAGSDLHIKHGQGGVGHQFDRELLVGNVAQQGHSQEQHADKYLSVDDKPHLIIL